MIHVQASIFKPPSCHFPTIMDTSNQVVSNTRAPSSFVVTNLIDLVVKLIFT